MSLLIFENIEKEYNKRVLLDKINLSVERGMHLALVGPNGTGKTTLLKIAMGIEPSDTGKVTIAKGIKIGYLSQNVKYVKGGKESTSETALFFEEVSRLEQKIRELEKQLEGISAESTSETYERLMKQYATLINQYEAIDGYTIEAKIKKVMLGLGLREESLTIPLSKLSGGEKMRVAMARILLEEPDLLLLDEPTNHLDIQATEWLEDFLKRFDGGVLVVSHDRYFLDQVATHVAELENGSIIERNGNYSTFLGQKQRMREYVIKEQKKIKGNVRASSKLIQQLKDKEKSKDQKSVKTSAGKLKSGSNEKLETFREREHLHLTEGPRLAFKQVKHVSKDILKVENLKKRFGHRKLFDDVTFHIRGGEKVGIIGPNGCGKTTLINILTNKDKDYEGTARLGEWVKYSYLGQEIQFEDEYKTVMQQILSKKFMGEQEARKFLGKFQFYDDEVHKCIFFLSGGERVRLYLACIMLEDADCLFMDEPTNHLDVPSRDAVEAAIHEFKGTIIAISHDRYFLNHCVNRILAVEEGKIHVYEGNYEVYKLQKQRELEDRLALEEKTNTKNKHIPTASAKRESNLINNDKVKRNPKMSVQDLEEKIMQLEHRIEELEMGFPAGTSFDAYREYEDCVNKRNELYTLWEELE